MTLWFIIFILFNEVGSPVIRNNCELILIDSEGGKTVFGLTNVSCLEEDRHWIRSNIHDKSSETLIGPFEGERNCAYTNRTKLICEEVQTFYSGIFLFLYNTTMDDVCNFRYILKSGFKDIKESNKTIERVCNGDNIKEEKAEGQVITVLTVVVVILCCLVLFMATILIFTFLKKCKPGCYAQMIDKIMPNNDTDSFQSRRNVPVLENLTRTYIKDEDKTDDICQKSDDQPVDLRNSVVKKRGILHVEAGPTEVDDGLHIPFSKSTSVWQEPEVEPFKSGNDC